MGDANDVHFLSERERNAIIDSYQKAARSLIMLNVTPPVDSSITDVQQLLLNLCQVRSNEICLFSSGSSEFLHDLFGDMPVHLIAGNGERIRLKNLEWISDSHSNKYHAFQKMISREEYNFILFAAATEHEEEIFKNLKHQPRAHSIKIGDSNSHARYHLPDTTSLYGLLRDIYHATLPSLS